MDGKLNSPETQLARMKADQKQHIQVFVRVRPMNTREKSKNALSVLDCPGSREVVVKERSSVNISKTFTFDRVFGPSSKQIDVYKSVVAPLLEEVLLGYNCTVFAYGQTSTGKTFTMEGAERTDGSEVSWENDPLAGIIPRSLSQLFDELRLQNAEFTVRVSLLELYNEELFDLLSPTENSKLKTLRLFEDSSRKGSVIIQGLEEVTVHNKNEVYRILEQGTKGRHTAATQMNANSSRSHTIFTVTVHIKESNVEGEELVKIGKLNLVDLAGSENIGRSGAIQKQAKEAGSINQSLLTLGRVITALVEHTPHVPYRESKLTRLLQDSLGGRTKTSIIATVSPASINLEETLSTLDYAHRAKDITNRPEINQKMTKRAVLKEYTEEIERLRRDLQASREKSGVFMDKENYDFMVSQIEAQTQEINEKVVQVRALEQTIEAKDGAIATLQGELDEAKDDLQTCHTILEETTETLKATRHELEVTRSERDQKSHIVRQQQKTEKELTAQAQKLLVTTEDATSNLEKLYRKLDRKKVVEQKNLDAGRRFNEDVTSGLSEVCETIEAFRKQHSVFCSKQRIIFESFRKEKEIKFANIKQNIAGFVETILEQKTRDLVHLMVNDIRVRNKENIHHVNEVSVSNSGILATSQNKLVVDFKTLMSKISEISSQTEKMLKDYEDKTMQQFETVRSFAETRLDALNAFEKQFILRCEELQSKESQLQIAVQKQDSMLKSNAMAFAAQLDTLKKTQETFQKEMSSVTTKMIGDVSDSMNLAKSLMDLVKNNNEGVVTKSEQLVTNLSKEVHCVGGNVQKSTAELKSNHAKVVDTIKGIETGVTEQFQTQVNRFSDLDKWNNTRCNEQDKELITFVSKFDKVADQFQSSATSQMDSLSVKLDEGQEADITIIEDTRTALGDHCAEVSMWFDQTAEDTGKQAGKVREFWETTYLVDSPTGATPQRKAYDFPRLLSATSPHERIVKRYLAERQEQIVLDENSDPTKIKKDEVF